MMPPDLNLPSDLFWKSALFAALIDLVLVLLLLWRIKQTHFHELKWVLIGTAAMFWAIFGTALLWGFWDSYYRHFLPDSMRWLGVINAMLYGAIGFALWWLSLRLPGNPVAAFCLLGGAEGLLEHLWGIYGFGVLEKVPSLQNASAISVLVFSFFEYVLYWGIVLGIAALLQGTWRQWTKLHQGQANAA
jgi:hypothetical protein